MNADSPFHRPEFAARYESWYAGPGRAADELEKRLLEKLLARFGEARTLLDIGCGTGHFTRWFAAKGLAATGLDGSRAMLTEARRLNRFSYVEGNALQLPFPDRSFDLVAMITALEFVADPGRALHEAVRVARQGLLLGVLNRTSLLARKYRASGKPHWQSARFFSPRELCQIVRTAAGPRLGRIHWRTTLWPLAAVGDLPLPYGGFIGLAAHLHEA